MFFINILNEVILHLNLFFEDLDKQNDLFL